MSDLWTDFFRTKIKLMKDKDRKTDQPTDRQTESLVIKMKVVENVIMMSICPNVVSDSQKTSKRLKSPLLIIIADRKHQLGVSDHQVLGQVRHV